MSTYVLTIINATPGQLAFTATRDNINLGTFVVSQDSPTFTTFSLLMRGGSTQNVGWVASQPGNPGQTVQLDLTWLNELQDLVLFPADSQNGFGAPDCLIIVNSTQVVVPLSVITQGEIPISGTILVNSSVEPDGGLKFVRFQNRVQPVFTDQPCCVHPETLVTTPNGKKMIKDVKKGDYVIDVHGNSVKVTFNIKSTASKKFVKIPSGSLSASCPDKDLLIRPDHPVLVDGKEFRAVEIVRMANEVCEITLAKPETVWSLCTQDRTFVMMNNVPVCTWSQKSWATRIRQNPQMYWAAQ
jgi:hypothetical protein